MTAPHPTPAEGTPIATPETGNIQSESPHCENCQPIMFCWSGMSTCAHRPVSAACTSIDRIISDTTRMVGETYHNPNPPADAIALSLATQVFLARKSADRSETELHSTKARLEEAEKRLKHLAWIGVGNSQTSAGLQWSTFKAIIGPGYTLEDALDQDIERRAHLARHHTSGGSKP